jgi:hypothetical protein
MPVTQFLAYHFEVVVFWIYGRSPVRLPSPVCKAGTAVKYDQHQLQETAIASSTKVKASLPRPLQDGTRCLVHYKMGHVVVRYERGLRYF